MTNAKCTPGPWEFVVKDDKYGQEPLIVGPEKKDGDRPVVCGAFTFSNDGFLAAAAPDYDMAAVALLAALQPLCDWDDGCLYVNGRATPELAVPMKALMDTVAKARGETQFTTAA
jgi:hypothetical protein